MKLEVTISPKEFSPLWKQLIKTNRLLEGTYLDVTLKRKGFRLIHNDELYEEIYYPYKIPKKSGGCRTIYVPQSDVKGLQKEYLSFMTNTDELEDMLINLLETKNPSLKEKYLKLRQLCLKGNYVNIDCVHGFKKNKSIITNAISHKDNQYFLKMDIKEAFPSIHFEEVIDIVDYYHNLQHFLKWCCMKIYYSRGKKSVLNTEIYHIEVYSTYIKTRYALAKLLCYKGILATGAPTSPHILNIYLRKVDEKLNSYCNHLQMNYTRYADDIIISSQKKISHRTRRYVENCLNDVHMVSNPKKTCFQKYTQKNVITGIVVSYDKNKRKGNIGIGHHKFDNLKHNLYEMNKNAGSMNEKDVARIFGMLSFLKSIDESRYDYLVKKYNIQDPQYYMETSF